MFKSLATQAEIQEIIKHRAMFNRDKKKVFPGDKIVVFCSDGYFDLVCTVCAVENSRIDIGCIEIMNSLFCEFTKEYVK